MNKKEQEIPQMCLTLNKVNHITFFGYVLIYLFLNWEYLCIIHEAYYDGVCLPLSPRCACSSQKVYIEHKNYHSVIKAVLWNIISLNIKTNVRRKLCMQGIIIKSKWLQVDKSNIGICTNLFVLSEEYLCKIHRNGELWGMY